MAVGTDIMTHSDLMLRPDPSRTVLRPFDPGDPEAFAKKGHPRAERIVRRVLDLDSERQKSQLKRIVGSLKERHSDLDQALDERFEQIKDALPPDCDLTPEQRHLIAGYFLQEYSFEAAALFNPSMAIDDMNGRTPPDGGVCFAISLRGIGEGHVSSVTFRTGTWCPRQGFQIDEPSEHGVTPKIEQQLEENGGKVTRIDCPGAQEPSEVVLFPTTDTQRQGIEDMRLCRFTEDDGKVRYLATYTAFSGSEARCELLEAEDFNTFWMRAMKGDVAATKGMALFPRRINGKYAMLGRQDSENVWLIYSDDLTDWSGGEKIICPHYFWEFVQMGNCGSPIEIDEGWLVLTHGVGEVRNYCIGAALLDKDDPSKLLKRMKLPLVHPSPKERDGYVPNVVYSCGGIVHDRTLLLPYGVADNFTSFASCSVDELLSVMEKV